MTSNRVKSTGLRRNASGQWFDAINADLPPDHGSGIGHELGHAVMHSDPMAEPKKVENQANLFAGISNARA